MLLFYRKNYFLAKKHFFNSFCCFIQLFILFCTNRKSFSQKPLFVKSTQYFVFVEVTSIRSGLRKRKRPESPQSTDPQVTEEWVDEDKLELWEIKQYGEK